MAIATSRKVATIGVILWMALIFALSSQSTLPATGGLPANLVAVAGHLVAYSVLAALIRLAIGGTEYNRRADLLAIALATLYGVSDEFHQSFVPGRDASVFDLAVDLAAATLGTTLVNLARAIRVPGTGGG